MVRNRPGPITTNSEPLGQKAILSCAMAKRMTLIPSASCTRLKPYRSAPLRTTIPVNLREQLRGAGVARRLFEDSPPRRAPIRQAQAVGLTSDPPFPALPASRVGLELPEPSMGRSGYSNDAKPLTKRSVPNGIRKRRLWAATGRIEPHRTDGRHPRPGRWRPDGCQCDARRTVRARTRARAGGCHRAGLGQGIGVGRGGWAMGARRADRPRVERAP